MINKKNLHYLMFNVRINEYKFDFYSTIQFIKIKIFYGFALQNTNKNLLIYNLLSEDQRCIFC